MLEIVVRNILFSYKHKENKINCKFFSDIGFISIITKNAKLTCYNKNQFAFTFKKMKIYCTMKIYGKVVTT